MHIVANVTGTYRVQIRDGEVIENGRGFRSESASRGRNGWQSDDFGLSDSEDLVKSPCSGFMGRRQGLSDFKFCRVRPAKLSMFSGS